jgi:hypothetical protein
VKGVGESHSATSELEQAVSTVAEGPSSGQSGKSKQEEAELTTNVVKPTQAICKHAQSISGR